MPLKPLLHNGHPRNADRGHEATEDRELGANVSGRWPAVLGASESLPQSNGTFGKKAILHFAYPASDVAKAHRILPEDGEHGLTGRRRGHRPITSVRRPRALGSQ